MSTRSLLRRAVRVADAWAHPHGIDRYVEQVVPTWSSTEVRGRIVAADRSTPGSVLLTVRPNGNWDGFRAGQHVQLTVEIDGVRHTRCYSLAAAESTTDVVLGVKAHPHGLVSRFLVERVEVGTVVGLTPAAGEFVLPGEPGARPERMLLISGGSGITPVWSMLRTLCDEGHTGPVTFLHYARSAEVQLLRSELDALAAAHPNVTVVLGYDDTPEAGHVTGLLDESHLAAADARWAEAETFVCGPSPLMDAVRARFEAAGAAERFHQEAFTLATALAEVDQVGGTVRFAEAGIDVESDGTTLLEQAEAAGLSPTHGCRMGICHTCVRDVTCGTVRDVVSGQLTSVDPSNGVGTSVRICTSAPVGDVTISL